MLGGMGAEGGPIDSLGGWGDGGIPPPNFTYPPISVSLYTDAARCCITTGVHMYTVTVTWGELTKTHRAWTLSSAKGWMYAYPNKDVFARVALFGKTVAIRYKR